MSIPKELQLAIDREVGRFPLEQLLKAREELTERYREQKRNAFMSTEAHRCAYVGTRLPATYAVLLSILQQCQPHIAGEEIHSVLDLGAGPGSVMWAACAVFSQIEKISLIERDRALADLGKRLATDSLSKAIREAKWQIENLEQIKTLPQHDLVVLSYAIGELSPVAIRPLIEACYNAMGKVLIVVEPGTPAGFERIRSVRQHLISLGGQMLAPCPHALECPMANGDWCHFSTRLERTSFHRRLKQGALGYEDEKFSYVVFSKTTCELPESRILRHPIRHSGHVNLTLCTKDGLKQVTVSRRTPEAYRKAKKADWGDAFNLLGTKI